MDEMKKEKIAMLRFQVIASLIGLTKEPDELILNLFKIIKDQPVFFLLP